MDISAFVKPIEQSRPVYRGLYKRKKNGILEPVYLFEDEDAERIDDAAVYQPAGKNARAEEKGRKERIDEIRQYLAQGRRYKIDSKKVAKKVYMEYLLS